MRNLARLLDRITLQRTNADGVIDHLAAAVGFAGVLADVGAGGREGVVLANQTHGIGVAPFAYEGDVARDIDVGGTERTAGNSLLFGDEAVAAGSMLHVVVAEAAQAEQDGIRSLHANGAIGGIGDGCGGLLQCVNGICIPLAVQQFFKQLDHDRQPDSAWDAFAAALRAGKLKVVQGGFNRAESWRTCHQTALHPCMKLLQRRLQLKRGL